MYSFFISLSGRIRRQPGKTQPGEWVVWAGEWLLPGFMDLYGDTRNSSDNLSLCTEVSCFLGFFFFFFLVLTVIWTEKRDFQFCFTELLWWVLHGFCVNSENNIQGKLWIPTPWPWLDSGPFQPNPFPGFRILSPQSWTWAISWNICHTANTFSPEDVWIGCEFLSADKNWDKIECQRCK